MELPVTSTVQAELNMEELIWDEAIFIAEDEQQEEVKEVAIVNEVINSVMAAVFSTSEEAVHVASSRSLTNSLALSTSPEQRAPTQPG